MRKHSLSFSDSFPVEAKMIFGFFALALDWSWAFIAYASPAFSVAGEVAPDALFGIAGLSGMVITFFCFGFLFRRISSRKGDRAITALMLIAVLVHSLVFILGSFVRLNEALYAIGWATGGVATAALLLRLGCFYSTLEKVRAGLYASLTLIGAGLVFAVAATVDARIARITACVCLFAASLITTRMPTSFAGVATFEADSSNPFRVVFSKNAPHGAAVYFVVMLLYSIAFGFTSALSGFLSDGTVPGIVDQIVFVLSGVLMIMLVIRLKSDLNLAVLQCVLLLFVALGMLPLSFVGSSFGSICCAIVLFGFALYDIVNWLTLSELAHKHNPVMTFGFGRGFLGLGLMIGRALCISIVGTFGVDERLIIFVSLVIVLCLIIGIVVSSFPALKMYMPELEPEQESSDVRSEDEWIETCSGICQEYRLSPRESEVFALLAKGRSAGVIQEALCISSHTVKAHTIHVYQKLGIHSRQELISMVEERIKR